jgi:hypothetical protein
MFSRQYSCKFYRRALNIVYLRNYLNLSKLTPILVLGYVFDFTRSCSCVQISLIASKGMVAALVLVIATIVATIVGG